MDELDSFDPTQYLRDGLKEVGWQTVDLWIASIALGSHLDLAGVTDIATGTRAPTRWEYDLLAAALNEQFLDLGRDHPILYWDDLPTAI